MLKMRETFICKNILFKRFNVFPFAEANKLSAVRKKMRDNLFNYNNENPGSNQANTLFQNNTEILKNNKSLSIDEESRLSSEKNDIHSKPLTLFKNSEISIAPKYNIENFRQKGIFERDFEDLNSE
jgi:hypothetical protein